MICSTMYWPGLYLLLMGVLIHIYSTRPLYSQMRRTWGFQHEGEGRGPVGAESEDGDVPEVGWSVVCVGWKGPNQTLAVGWVGERIREWKIGTNHDKKVVLPLRNLE